MNRRTRSRTVRLFGLCGCFLLVSCGVFTQDTPPSVPGTSAFVNDRTVSPLHEGQYVGQLQPVKGGIACKGTSGSESTGSISVTLRIDEECRVFVESIDP